MMSQKELEAMRDEARKSATPQELAKMDLHERILEGKGLVAVNAADQAMLDNLQQLVRSLGSVTAKLTNLLEKKGVSPAETGLFILTGQMPGEAYDVQADAVAFADLVTGAVDLTLGEVTQASLKEHQGPVASVYRSINASLYRQLRQAGVGREAISKEVMATIKPAVAAKLDGAKRGGSTLP